MKFESYCFTRASVLVCFFICGAPYLHAQSTSWQPVAEFSGKNIWSIAADSSRNIYVDVNDAATYRSTDNGVSWSRVGNGGRMAVAPNGAVFAAVGNRVARSEDGGETWEDFMIQPFAPVSDIISIAAGPDGEIFLSAFDRGLFRSLDNGETWEKTGEGLGRVWTMAFGSDGRMYAGTDIGVFRSSDDGHTWTASGNFEQGNEVRALAVGKGGTVLAGTAASGGGGIYYSADNGDTWRGTGGSARDIYSLATVGGSIVAGTVWEGLSRSTDGGNSWQPYNDGIATGHISFYSLAHNGRGFVFAGGGDGEGVYRRYIPGAVGDVASDARVAVPVIEQRGNILHYTIDSPGYIGIVIYNSSGEEVERVADSWHEAGEYRMALHRRYLPSGIYYGALMSGNSMRGVTKIAQY